MQCNAIWLMKARLRHLVHHCYCCYWSATVSGLLLLLLQHALSFSRTFSHMCGNALGAQVLCCSCAAAGTADHTRLPHSSCRSQAGAAAGVTPKQLLLLLPLATHAARGKVLLCWPCCSSLLGTAAINHIIPLVPGSP